MSPSRDWPTIVPARVPNASHQPLVVVLPGGGYAQHAPHEAGPIADWLSDAGLNALVVHYPVAPARHPEPVTMVRGLLAELRRGEHPATFDRERIAVLGFSAGGHLAALLSNAPTAREKATGAHDDRPDLAVLAYPVISMLNAPHAGSARNLLGADAALADRAAVSAERLVDDRTPPTFLWHTADDEAVPLTHALAYAGALALAGRDVDLHVYAHGGHGRGLATGEGPLEGWSPLAVDWFAARGWCAPTR